MARRERVNGESKTQTAIHKSNKEIIAPMLRARVKAPKIKDFLHPLI